MDLSAIRIILVAPTHPGNIGAVARAMKTMGLCQLFLVRPKLFPHEHALEMASGADDILEQAQVVDSVAEAISGCQLVFASSARPREIHLPGMKPEVCARMIATCPNETEVAILFGREHAGLTNAELLQANYHVCIPANPEYSSLNLAQAVQIIAYELRLKLLAPEVQTRMADAPLATADQVQGLHDHLEAVMMAVDFLKPSNPRMLPLRIRRLLNRAGLEQREVNILRGLLTQVQKKIADKDDGDCSRS
ncbi:MAG: RNA methyltransferase [Legionellaceae bacterium]|nr:RNA methyltransferase [Legionellaceae bacterium]